MPTVVEWLPFERGLGKIDLYERFPASSLLVLRFPREIPVASLGAWASAALFFWKAVGRPRSGLS